MKRTARRMRLCAHLHAAGPRPVLEALLAVESGGHSMTCSKILRAFLPTSITPFSPSIQTSQGPQHEYCRED
jgi:hypothetical protein